MTETLFGTESLFTTVRELKPYIAFCKYTPDENGKETQDFKVFLINPEEKTYPHVLVYTGMFGDGLTFPPIGIKDNGPLEPFGNIILDAGNVATLDFIAWFKINLITRDNNVIQMDFSFGKSGGIDYEKNLQYISKIRMDGIILPLEERQ
jgi:hypothetical protein